MQRDHRCLAELLRPGISVLDVGCGTGAITAGVAKAVGPHGHVVGIDRDEALLQLARTEHGILPNLRFECGDAAALKFCAEFDIVTAARTLQWIAEPALAISKMKQAAKPAGVLVVLDYNHASNAWDPKPPHTFRLFYSAFLAWRQTNRWDNEIADHLPELFRSAGLVDVKSRIQDEVVERGGPLILTDPMPAAEQVSRALIHPQRVDRSVSGLPGDHDLLGATGERRGREARAQ